FFHGHHVAAAARAPGAPIQKIRLPGGHSRQVAVAITSKLGHVIESQQFSRAVLEELIARADEIKREPHRFMGRLAGQVMAALFYEPSTRTRLSFEAAMLRLGRPPMGSDNAREFSFAANGATLVAPGRLRTGYP